MEQLQAKITDIITQYGGTWGIALDDLDTGKSLLWNAEEIFYAASVIKVPIMIATFTAFERGEIALSDRLTLTREDQVGGSGVLQHMTPGTKLTIYDVLTLMIIQSDNTATNMLIDLVGINQIQKSMRAIGLVDSQFYNKLMTVPVNRQGNNVVTAAEMTFMLKQMAMGKIVSIYVCEQMIAIMKKQQLRDCLPGKLPWLDSEVIGSNQQWEFANKTGSVTGIRHDIGLFYVGSRSLAASVLSRDLDDFKARQAMMDIGLAIYHFLNK